MYTMSLMKGDGVNLGCQKTAEQCQMLSNNPKGLQSNFTLCALNVRPASTSTFHEDDFWEARGFSDTQYEQTGQFDPVKLLGSRKQYLLLFPRRFLCDLTFPTALHPEDSFLILEIRHLNFSQSGGIVISLPLSFIPFALRPLLSPFHRFFQFYSLRLVPLPFHRMRRESS